MRVSSDTRNVLMLDLVYDFMSYAAEHLNVDVINSKTFMAGRVIMLHEIKRLSEEPEYVELHMLTQIFHASDRWESDTTIGFLKGNFGGVF